MARASVDPHEREILRLLAARAPSGFLFFLGCVLVSTLFEVIRFPERRGWMLAFAGAFAVLTGVSHALIRSRPKWIVPVLLAFVNVVGVALNAYHAIVASPVAPCLWTLTGLLASAAVILPWGGRRQAIASVGSLASYPLHLLLGNGDPLSWAAGGTYLLIVIAMSVVGAMLYSRYLWTDLRLTGKLYEREARLQTYFDLALFGTAILLPDGSCAEVNDELSRILGYSSEELLHMRWSELTTPDERAAGATQLAGALEAGRQAPIETRLLRKDGSAIHASVGMRGLAALPGGARQVIAVVQDITERKRADVEREALLARELAARREAEAANHAKDAFLATVSHELRTPLSPILAWAVLLRHRRLNAEQTERGLSAIERNAHAQAQLIEDLLDVSRIVSGKLRLELNELDVAPVIREALEVVRPAARRKGVEIEIALDAAPCLISGDADRLRQVCWNLLSNAIKFTPEGGRVRITLEQRDGNARITVSDTGEGISPAFLPHIFERFRQADVTSTREHGGLGIGLAIVREVVDLHAGTVRAESAGEGQGAVFTVELPLLRASRAADRTRARVADYAPLDGLHVLVVDDDPESNEVVRALLSSCGADVRTACSAAEALDLLGRWHADVMVSDISMPGEDGYALMSQLRARERGQTNLPVIALTAYASSADRERALSAGFEAHVRKPLRGVELLAAVEEAARTRLPS